MALPEEINIIIPVYNNASTIEELFAGIDRVTGPLSDRYNFTVVFVNDASVDGSGEVISGLPRNPGLDYQLVDMEKNSGQVLAVLAGFKAIRNEAPAIVISADLQDPPEVITQLLEAADDGTGLVIAARNRHHSLPAESFHRLVHFFYHDYPVTGFDVAFLRESVWGMLVAQSGRPQFLQVEMLKAASRIKTIYYDKMARQRGRSQWSFIKRLFYLLTFLIYYTYTPLILAIIILVFAASVFAARFI